MQESLLGQGQNKTEKDKGGEMKLTEYQRESALANLYVKFEDAIGEAPAGLKREEIIKEFQKALSSWQIRED